MVFLEDGRLPDFYDVVPPSMVLFLLVISLIGGFLNGFSLSYVWTYYLITWYFHSFLTDPIGRWWRIGRGEKDGGRGENNLCAVVRLASLLFALFFNTMGRRYFGRGSFQGRLGVVRILRSC